MEIAEYEKMYHFEEKYWWWIGKRELIKGIIDKFILKLDSGAILDVGCGTGMNLKYLEDYGAVIGLDSSKEALDFCKIRGDKNLILGDAERLPFEDDAFDLITALDLLEHIDDDKALKGFHRVLKPNSPLVLTVPAWSFLWSRHDEALHHKRRYSKGHLRDIMEANGFLIEKLSYWNFFLFLPIVAMRLMKRRSINQKVETDVEELPATINRLLTFILRTESYLIPHVNLPIGISLMCIGKTMK
ncbi:MAG TPA: class I SAM-dependent methyltransferase [Dehalococcoidia bacterium]|nr:class I SAM-dependent methyltransferase [Dehalococcoidia bacterium]